MSKKLSNIHKNRGKALSKMKRIATAIILGQQPEETIKAILF